MNGDSNAEPAAGLESIDRSDAVNHELRAQRLEGAIDRATDQLYQALTQGFASGEQHIAHVRAAFEALVAAR